MYYIVYNTIALNCCSCICKFRGAYFYGYYMLLLYSNKLHEDGIFFAIKDWFAMKWGKVNNRVFICKHLWWPIQSGFLLSVGNIKHKHFSIFKHYYKVHNWHCPSWSPSNNHSSLSTVLRNFLRKITALPGCLINLLVQGLKIYFSFLIHTQDNMGK